MAQHDYDLADATGAAFRADGNLLFQAIASMNSGAAEPATKFANMGWFDTANNLMKVRNEANAAWVTIAEKTATEWKPYWNTALIDAAFQPLDATLTSLAAVSGVAGDILFASGTDVWARLPKGTDDKVLTLASGLPSWAAAGASGIDAVTLFIAGDTWTPSSSGTTALVFCIGGGGGGGSVSGGGGDGGGGAGAAAIHFISDTTGISSETVTIGSGGGAQSNGGTSSLGALASAGGGTGSTGPAGGAGGTATAGTMQTDGGGGGAGDDVGTPGVGGSSFWGGGGAGPTGENNGKAGEAYGSGGSGSVSGGSNKTGGSGKVGAILVLEW